MAAAKSGKKGGRPPAARAGEVDARILSTASALFLAHGFEGTSCEQVAAMAPCGKASIYARYADKSALFTAALDHILSTHTASLTMTSVPQTGDLRLLCAARIEEALAPEHLALLRLLIAEATRFPERVASAYALCQQGLIKHISEPLAAAAAEPDTSAWASKFGAQLAVRVLPVLQMQALLDPDRAALRAAIHSRLDELLDQLPPTL